MSDMEERSRRLGHVGREQREEIKGSEAVRIADLLKVRPLHFMPAGRTDIGIVYLKYPP